MAGIGRVGGWKGCRESAHRRGMSLSCHHRMKNHPRFGANFKIDSAKAEHNALPHIVVEVNPVKPLLADGLGQI